jgi:group II intron reverse transcriptase/maturase
VPKGNSSQLTGLQAQDWPDLSDKLDRVRKVAGRDKRLRFTTLLHHITPRLLLDAYGSLKKDAASGVDEVTWREYQDGLESRLLNLHDGVQSGRYRAKPSKRIYIPKADGRERPIGIAALEDKIVQSAVRRVLEAIYEKDFLDFSYGFRPKRGAHNALDAVFVGIKRRHINWVLDADLKSFFDTISHEWLMEFLKHRIADPRIHRLIAKWLKAGVSEDGEWSETTVGTPQGAVISPLLANIFLHYALDLWAQHWRENQAQGHMIFVRYADDFIVGFQHKQDAARFYQALKERLAKFGLSLQEKKTRIIEFGRFAAENRKARGEGKPETFDFLGFTHICGTTRTNKRFLVRRHPKAKRLRSKLKEMRQDLMRNRHRPIKEQGQKLRAILRGVYQYYAVPGTYNILDAFRTAARRHWRHALKRRSQKYKTKRINRWIDYWTPKVKILHPYPDQRLRV